ncbi:deoxyribodipyrimidine photo-lyase (single-stranded DNA-specific) [Hyunsoonleella jejuensis]|uniref:Cryptochrome DASH n=1 Tax=Hyunsoonleella jejuensis TaxID=419940 RepID=A0A1H9K7V2_9FLAO|nr:DASH family cryptochrome [Hyunsoonleella jejuensis]SEQ95240.1 deoxyribodipyrimidine photo-lyase (single-stranded DNA-specific) [Hyunsoonleella jejuensis]
MSEKQKSTGLVWFRNDLRVNDNIVLNAAIKQHEHIVAVYCFDPRHYQTGPYGFKKTEKFRAKFLIETIIDLKRNLHHLNIELFVYQDKPEYTIPELIEKFNITSIYLQNEWTSEEVEVLELVKFNCSNNISFNEYYNQFLFHPKDIDIPFSQIPQVFTNFRKKVEKYSSRRATNAPEALKTISNISNNTKIPSLKELGFDDFQTHPNSAFPFEGGENAALNRLNNYFFQTKKLGFYKKTRNGLIGTDFSSKFSPWLANGSISARTIYWQVKQFEKEYYKNQSTYWLIFELIWRDYFKYISLKHGNTIFKIGGILKKDYEWKNEDSLINSWISGETRSAFVNANMIEIKETGWMSNRGRQNVASFFAKDLKLDWRIGAAYFEAMLLDYDVHSNYGNWMYVSGVGNDPRDRKFNVDLQAERYDASGKFQNLWLQRTLF